MRIAAILLAAGRSSRFGAADKVSASLGGRPLVRHAADALAVLPLAGRWLVAADSALRCPGFDTIVNDHPEAGMARSIGLGVAAARQRGADAVLIALADMPLVPAGHFARLVAHWRDIGGIVASGHDGQVMPPAVFGAAWFEMLATLTGDSGARRLLEDAAVVAAPPGTLADVDRVEDLHRAARMIATDEPCS